MRINRPTTPATARSDVYALGAVGYWLLTGTAPFRGRTIVEVCAGHLHAALELPSQRAQRTVPQQLEQLIVDCLAKDQAARPQGAAALFERLRALDAPPWTQAQALASWSARSERAPSAEPGSLEYARTMAIARRTARPAE